MLAGTSIRVLPNAILLPAPLAKNKTEVAVAKKSLRKHM